MHEKRYLGDIFEIGYDKWQAAILWLLFTSWKKYSKGKPVPIIFQLHQRAFFPCLAIFPFLFTTAYHLGICGCEQLKLII